MINYDAYAQMIAQSRPQPIAPGHTQVSPGIGHQTQIQAGVDIEGMYRLAKDIFDLDDTKADALIEEMTNKYNSRIYNQEDESKINQELDIPVIQDKLRAALEERANTNVRKFRIPLTTKDEAFGNVAPRGPQEPPSMAGRTPVMGLTKAPPSKGGFEHEEAFREVPTGETGPPAGFQPDYGDSRPMRDFYVPIKKPYGEQIKNASGDEPEMRGGFWGEQGLKAYRAGPGGAGLGAKTNKRIEEEDRSYHSYMEMKGRPIDITAKDAPTKFADLSARTSSYVSVMTQEGVPERALPVIDGFYHMTEPLFLDYIKSGAKDKQQVAENIITSYTSMVQRAGLQDPTTFARLMDMVYTMQDTPEGMVMGGSRDREYRKAKVWEYFAQSFTPRFVPVPEGISKEDKAVLSQYNQEVKQNFLENLDMVWPRTRAFVNDAKLSETEKKERTVRIADIKRKAGIKEELRDVGRRPKEAPVLSGYLRRAMEKVGMAKKPKSGG